jgi:photosystem II stability/assembly factor-like uncharacterized protein
MFRRTPRETGALQESRLTATAVRGIVAVLTLAAAVCAWRQARLRAESHRSGRVAESIRADPSFWFMAQRLSGDGRIPVRARGRALAEAGAGAGLASAPGTWASAGPLNIGGRATAIAVDPNDPNRIWLGSAEGGVFRSDDAGVNWTPVFDGQTAAAIGSIAVHPTDSNTVYVGTGEDNGGGFAYDGEGIFRTTDGGATWTSLGLAEVRRIGRIAIDPSQPARLFAAAGGDWFNKDQNRGIYRSTDGGLTWQKVLYVADDAGGIDVAIDPANPSRVYAAIWQRQIHSDTWYVGGPASGVWRSSDGGATWSRLTNGLPAGPDVGRIGLAVAPSSPNVVYALVVNAEGNIDGVFRSTDYGSTWANQNAVIALFGFSYYFGNIRVDPGDANTVYVLDLRLLKSTDGGSTFTPIAAHVHVDWHDLVVSGRVIVGANDGGFCRSRNNGSSWDLATTLPITQFYDLAIARPDPRVVIGGTQDNGTIRTLTGGPSDWSTLLEGDGFQCGVEGATSALVYAERQYGDIMRSTDGGGIFMTATTGIDPGERCNWNTPITLDPASASTLYTGWQRVYRSTDGALSWTPISLDLPGGAAPGAAGSGTRGAGSADHTMNLVRHTITVVSVSPIDPGVLWAGTDDGRVWVRADSGSSWSRVDPPGTASWVTDIAGDPFDARAAYLTVTGYRQGDRTPYVRATSDLGATWRDLSGTLPQLPVNCILPDSEWRGRLFLGNDLGVYLSDDGGATWSPLHGGMPYVVVLDLERHDPTHTVYAATHGRSIYTFDLDQLPPADGDHDGVDNNHDCALADPGAFSAPGEAGPLSLAAGAAGESILSWPGLAASSGPGTVYDVASGSIASLVSSGFAASTSLACGLSVPGATDGSVPPTGAGIYYVVRGRNACGAGTWGRDSAGRERTPPACP